MRQPLISNFFGPNDPGRTVNHTLEQNPPPNYIRHHTMIQKDGRGLFWAVLPALPALRLGELDIYFDRIGGKWINHIEVRPQYQRCGVAARMVRTAIQDYGHIYASNSHIDPGGYNDTRHLSQEGAALVNGLIASGAMQANWLRPPVI